MDQIAIDGPNAGGINNGASGPKSKFWYCLIKLTIVMLTSQTIGPE